MKIFITGEEKRFEEIKFILPIDAEIIYQAFSGNLDETDLSSYDLVIDLNLDDEPENLLCYAGLKDKIVLGCAVKKQLTAMVSQLPDKLECNLIGMNLLPTFINRSLKEVSIFDKDKTEKAEAIFTQLNWQTQWVDDRVGMVTPRVIFMIINEAFYTLQEGTASEKDIDISMKLGTNYPFGPFEWSDKIGIKTIYETLEAIYQDTNEGRYKICPLLKTRYLKGKVVSA
ncbi:MAG: 3-hydroxyacyl-CoA dehydrogenase family protein [Bacteroidetes bacterium]|nr:3-hydroxyacyl-CoA dehydrogenase family protein [Bacteroidota bacterium]